MLIQKTKIADNVVQQATYLSREQTIELKLCLSVIKLQYGYDFSHYSKDSLVRRLHTLVKEANVKCISELIPKFIYDKEFFESAINKLTIGVTEFFRDTEFFVSFRNNVIPTLTTFPYLKMWHAGCSTGEEVYSLAMILAALGLHERSISYGTDINNIALNKARKGIYAQKAFENKKADFKKIVGKVNLNKFYQQSYEYCKINDDITKASVFSHHNLTKDGVFGEMNVIFCRNVLIYFDEVLQNRVLRLLTNSLRRGGYLCLGTGESIFSSEVQQEYITIDSRNRIYRKKFL